MSGRKLSTISYLEDVDSVQAGVAPSFTDSEDVDRGQADSSSLPMGAMVDSNMSGIKKLLPVADVSTEIEAHVGNCLKEINVMHGYCLSLERSEHFDVRKSMIRPTNPTNMRGVVGREMATDVAGAMVGVVNDEGAVVVPPSTSPNGMIAIETTADIVDSEGEPMTAVKADGISGPADPTFVAVLSSTRGNDVRGKAGTTWERKASMRGVHRKGKSDSIASDARKHWAERKPATALVFAACFGESAPPLPEEHKQSDKLQTLFMTLHMMHHRGQIRLSLQPSSAASSFGGIAGFLVAPDQRAAFDDGDFPSASSRRASRGYQACVRTWESAGLREEELGAAPGASRGLQYTYDGRLASKEKLMRSRAAKRARRG